MTAPPRKKVCPGCKKEKWINMDSRLCEDCRAKETEKEVEENMLKPRRELSYNDRIEELEKDIYWIKKRMALQEISSTTFK